MHAETETRWVHPSIVEMNALLQLTLQLPLRILFLRLREPLHTALIYMAAVTKAAPHAVHPVS